MHIAVYMLGRRFKRKITYMIPALYTIHMTIVMTYIMIAISPETSEDNQI